MSLGTVTIGGDTFNDAGSGRYIAASVVFGGPRDEMKISAGALAKKANPPTVNASITRLFEMSVSTNPLDPTAPTALKRCTITIGFQVEPGVTAADIDGAFEALSTAVTADMINHIMNGGN